MPADTSTRPPLGTVHPVGVASHGRCGCGGATYGALCDAVLAAEDRALSLPVL